MRKVLFILLLLISSNIIGQTKLTIHVEKAGTLPTLIEDSQKYGIEELVLSGSLNGTDIKYIREIGGSTYNKGKLAVLDISEADIVSGGDSYYYSSWHDTYYRTVDNEISTSMFDACVNLVSVKLPKRVHSITAWAFSKCQRLTTIVFPEKIALIGPESFSYCRQLSTIRIPNTVNKIERGAFMYCGNLESVILPENITVIDESTFNGCAKLSTITIPTGVTTLKWYAFGECKSLTTIILPEKVSILNSGVFSECTGLKEIYSRNRIPPVCGSHCFQSVDRNNCKIVVPKGCSEVYREKKYWMDFNNIIEDEDTGVNESQYDNIKVFTDVDKIVIQNTLQNQLISIYNNIGHLIRTIKPMDSETIVCLPKGQLYIIKIEKKSFKVYL